MSARDESCHSDEHRASLTRLPQLAEPTIQFNVTKELGQLHQCGGWKSDQRPQFEDLGKICGLPNRAGFNQGKYPHGSTSGRGEDFDSVSGRKTPHPSSPCTKGGNGSRRLAGFRLRNSAQC